MSDAEKVVKALREYAQTTYCDLPKQRTNALADFVEAADAVVGRPDPVEPTKRQLALYDAALARLREVLR